MGEATGRNRCERRAYGTPLREEQQKIWKWEVLAYQGYWQQPELLNKGVKNQQDWGQKGKEQNMCRLFIWEENNNELLLAGTVWGYLSSSPAPDPHSRAG